MVTGAREAGAEEGEAVTVGVTQALVTEIVRSWLPAAAPPPDLTVSQWADAHRYLPESSAARGARWQTDRVPYLRGVMDAVHEPGVRAIAVMKAAQLGGSEAIHNILGYHMQYDPSPMLLVHPTEAVAEEWSKERLADMIRRTPALAEAIDESQSTLLYKVFVGGYLAIGGANSPNSFARRAVRIAAGDDVDRFPAVVGEEGDPADLLRDRTRTFDDALELFVSTPALKHGRIHTLYLRSDQRRYCVPCPACGHEDWITWSDAAHWHVVWEGRDPETARLKCPRCGELFDEPDRRAMIAQGVWRPQATAQEPGLVGFHLPAMVSTLGVSLSDLVAKWLSAHEKGRESLRVFVNTTLAEGWEEKGTRMQPHLLLHRREDYGDGVEVPEPVGALTCGVDVQQNRFELQVVGWGLHGERWVVDYRTIDGDPRAPETQELLLEALTRRYTHALGPLLPIHATCIDTGHHTDAIYDFVLRHQARRIFAVKGQAGGAHDPIVGKPSDKKTGRNQIPVRLYPVFTDPAKTEIYSSLALAAPSVDALGPLPNYTHFPLGRDTIDEEYFAQLCAEHKEVRYNKARVATHEVWVQDRERNEALDTMVYALAAYRLLNPNIRQMHEAIRVAAEAMTAQAETPAAVQAATPPSPPKPRQRQAAVSGYLR